MVASSTTMSCAVAMTARARPSRRGAAPVDVAAALDTAALLTTRAVCPVSGDVADKTNLPNLGVVNHGHDQGHAPYFAVKDLVRTDRGSRSPFGCYFPVPVVILGSDDPAVRLSSSVTRQPPRL